MAKENRPNVTIALLFIVGGTLLLLDNLNLVVIPWDNLLAFWPFLLIFFGTEKLVKDTPVAKVLAFLLAFVIGAGMVWLAVTYTPLR